MEAPIPGSSDPQASRSAVNDQFIGATLMTFTAMSFYDPLDDRDRRRIVVPFADEEQRSHWNPLPESGRLGVPLRDLTHGSRSWCTA